MIAFIKKILGIKPPPDYKELVKNGAVIIDVRTRVEFNNGHIKGSVNLPLETLPANCNKIKKNKVIITCCASGMRSATAKRLFISRGYERVFNGGGWMRLRNKIN